MDYSFYIRKIISIEKDLEGSINVLVGHGMHIDMFTMFHFMETLK